MKTKSTRWRLLALLVLFIPVSFSAQDFRTVRDGIEYAEVIHKLGGDPVKINLLRLDLTKVRLDVHHAMDAAIGTEKTSSIAMRHGAVAAINAGFFRLDKTEYAGDASGVLMVDNKLLSESTNNRIALFILNSARQSSVTFSHININGLVQIGKKDFYSSGINRERKKDELIIFTPEFHSSTLTDNNGIEIIVRKGRIWAIVDGKGNNGIPRDGYVISANDKTANDLRTVAKAGTKVKLRTVVTHNAGSRGFPDDVEFRGASQAFPSSEDITNGVPQLIRNGKIDITWEQEKASRSFVETRHPRTAVAKLKDGKFLMITVDGRQPGVSVGMNLQELAEYLLSLGAVDAMNLDGGGSTTMFLDGRVVNKPSDKEGERKVSDAILVTLRRNSRNKLKTKSKN